MHIDRKQLMNDRHDRGMRAGRVRALAAATFVATVVASAFGGGRDTVPGPPVPTAPASAWLSGTIDERFDLVAKHLRGFDVAMLETGHRYVELYWAGRDRNWSFAQYQIDKIRTAIGNGVQRRPSRAPSAKLLDAPLNLIEAAVKSTDGAAFDRGFALLTDTCNACHAAERVPFITVRPPTVRLSPVRFTAPASEPRP
jgi:cytochrome c1